MKYLITVIGVVWLLTGCATAQPSKSSPSVQPSMTNAEMIAVLKSQKPAVFDANTSREDWWLQVQYEGLRRWLMDNSDEQYHHRVSKCEFNVRMFDKYLNLDSISGSTYDMLMRDDEIEWQRSGDCIVDTVSYGQSSLNDFIGFFPDKKFSATNQNMVDGRLAEILGGRTYKTVIKPMIDANRTAQGDITTTLNAKIRRGNNKPTYAESVPTPLSEAVVSEKNRRSNKSTRRSNRLPPPMILDTNTLQYRPATQTEMDRAAREYNQRNDDGEFPLWYTEKKNGKPVNGCDAECVKSNKEISAEWQRKQDKFWDKIQKGNELGPPDACHAAPNGCDVSK